MKQPQTDTDRQACNLQELNLEGLEDVLPPVPVAGCFLLFPIDSPPVRVRPCPPAQGVWCPEPQLFARCRPLPAQLQRVRPAQAAGPRQPRDEGQAQEVPLRPHHEAEARNFSSWYRFCTVNPKLSKQCHGTICAHWF